MTPATCEELILLIATTSSQVPHKDKKYIHKLFLTQKANKQNPANQKKKKKTQIPTQKNDRNNADSTHKIKQNTHPTPRYPQSICDDYCLHLGQYYLVASELTTLGECC